MIPSAARPSSLRLAPVAAGVVLAVSLIGACSSEDRVSVSAGPPVPVERDETVYRGAGADPVASAAESELVDAADASVLVERSAGATVRRKLAADARVAVAPSEGIAFLPHPFPSPPDAVPVPAEDRERYQALDDNATIRVADEPVSTFSIDVDTGAYANVRRFLDAGQLPPEDAVRIEELVNYFDYDYAVPDGTDVPFAASTELGPTPWNPATRLLRIGLKAYEPAPETRPAANLVFLVDVSGSMASPDKLGLLKTSLKLLAGELTAEDRVGIVVYAGASGVVLEPVAGDDTRAIARALDALAAGGSTNGEAGIETAYRLADEHFVDGGVNRVILATDGDFNVGTAGVDELVALIEERRASGIALTTLGFGTGNYNDHLMERLADSGDGAYAYIDTLNEARKVLVDELESTLLTVARDVKIQLEFNPALVAEYRLIGYANRLLANEDFTDDRVDAGEIGAGHAVTALYEIALHGEGGERHAPRRFGEGVPEDASGGELAVLRLRYKLPDEDESRPLETPIRAADAVDSLDGTSDDYRFAAAVAAFGQALRGDTRLGDFDLDDAAALAADATGEDRFGYRAEFVRLATLAASLASVADPLTARRGGDG